MYMSNDHHIENVLLILTRTRVSEWSQLIASHAGAVVAVVGVDTVLRAQTVVIVTLVDATRTLESYNQRLKLEIN